MKTSFISETGERWRCLIKESAVADEGGNSVTVYGVKLFKQGCEFSSSEYECAFVRDITSVRKVAEEFAELAVRNKLRSVHLEDAVCDFIGTH